MTSATKKTPCVFCGDSPVHHALHYVSTGINILASLAFPSNPRSAPRFLQFERSEIVRALSRILLSLLALVRIIHYADTPGKETTGRTICIWTEASKRGIRMQEVVVFGQRRDEMRAWLPRVPGGSRNSWHYFQSIPIPPWLPQKGLAWVDDKRTFKSKFEKQGLPVAQGGNVVTLAQAQALFTKLGTAVITKPREGSRARHTTVSIRTPEELATGFRRAQQLCPFVMVEEFIPGSVYRATCVGREVIGVIQFIKPETVANGSMTVAKLREHHNTHKRFPTLTDVQEDGWFYDAIQHQGYTLESVPPAGTRVLLSEHSERPNGGYFVDVTDSVPSETIAEIERAAEACEVDIVGFDIISKDLTNVQERFVFIEGNTLPFIEIHDIPYEGLPRNVAGAVWDMWGLLNPVETDS